MDTSSTSPVVIDETSARYDGWRIVGVCFLVATFGWGLGLRANARPMTGSAKQSI